MTRYMKQITKKKTRIYSTKKQDAYMSEVQVILTAMKMNWEGRQSPEKNPQTQ